MYPSNKKIVGLLVLVAAVVFLRSSDVRAQNAPLVEIGYGTSPQSTAVAMQTITASAGPGGTISPNGTWTAPYLSFPVFTITPDPGFHVVSLIANGVDYGPRTGTIPWGALLADLNLAVSFASDQSTYDIISSASLGGTISPGGTTAVSAGGSQTYSIIADSGFQIDQLLVDGDAVGNQNVGIPSTYDFVNVQLPHTINAQFIANSFNVTSSAGPGGTISPLGTTTVPVRGGQIFSIVPDQGYQIADVLVDGVSKGAVSTFNMAPVLADHTISAIFTSSQVATTTTVTVPINLALGWNLITLPVQPVSTTTGQSITYTAESFGQLANADVVTGWDSASQSYISHIVGFPIGDFPLTVGTGFFVHKTAGGNISLSGSTTTPVTSTIVAGWNLLGHSDPISTTAEAFGLAIMAGVDVVSKFDSLSQQWLSHIVSFPINNFAVNSGEGVFVHKP